MGYFSNGTEGDGYEAKYCSRCIHGDNHRGKKDGCPVMLSHVLYAYQLCNEEKHPGKHMLDLLIPREGAFNGECRMFVDAKVLGVEKRSESLRSTTTDTAIPNIPRKWMWDLCADETRSSISTPFRQRVWGRSWDIATNGQAILFLEASGDIQERADAPQLDGLVASWAKPAVTQRVEFAQLWKWLNVKDKLRKCGDCNGKGCEDCDSGKYPVAVPGKLAGLVVNRVLFRDRLRHIQHSGDVTVTAPADYRAAPVCIDGGNWRLYVMSMVPDVETRAPVFRVRKAAA